MSYGEPILAFCAVCSNHAILEAHGTLYTECWQFLRMNRLIIVSLCWRCSMLKFVHRTKFSLHGPYIDAILISWIQVNNLPIPFCLVKIIIKSYPIQIHRSGAYQVSGRLWHKTRDMDLDGQFAARVEFQIRWTSTGDWSLSYSLSSLVIPCFVLRGERASTLFSPNDSNS